MVLCEGRCRTARRRARIERVATTEARAIAAGCAAEGENVNASILLVVLQGLWDKRSKCVTSNTAGKEALDESIAVWQVGGIPGS